MLHLKILEKLIVKDEFCWDLIVRTGKMFGLQHCTHNVYLFRKTDMFCTVENFTKNEKPQTFYVVDSVQHPLMHEDNIITRNRALVILPKKRKRTISVKSFTGTVVDQHIFNMRLMKNILHFILIKRSEQEKSERKKALRDAAFNTWATLVYWHRQRGLYKWETRKQEEEAWQWWSEIKYLTEADVKKRSSLSPGRTGITKKALYLH